ncbi:MAG: hypothetical protein COY80_04660 [Candidatus Pacebacteria bacterium CG_4_10_14_0_8_um_filter_42_14]|nr:MAG: hypothetical protein COY80_04660 [Candidatus Pacebacteria bacterium CG_4_10_14_0_8_um_filter_42_14]
MNIKLKSYWIYFVSILLLGAVIRFYQLGSIPHGITWDEAAIGYNGHAILTTRRDEWLERLPISFRSFGDYKAPLAIYLNGFSTFVFGMNPFGVRFPFAAASIFAIAGWMLFLKELKLFSKKDDFLILISGLILALNPWHIHYSRVGFESGLSLALAVWGWWLLVRSLHSQKLRFLFLQSFMSAVLLVASLYIYHSAKIVVPIMTVVIFLFATKPTKQSFLRLLPISIFSLLLAVPLIRDSLYGQGATRAGVLLFSQGYLLTELIGAMIKNLGAQLSPAFLVLGKNISSLRDGGGSWGFVLPTTYILAALAIPLIVWKKLKNKKILIFASLFVLIGSAPAFMSTLAPHSNRGLFAVLGIILLATVGLKIVLELAESSRWKKYFLAETILGTLFLLHLFFFATFWKNYTTVFASQSASDFQDGYIEAFSIAHQYELGVDGKPKVDKILFSSEYGQPYIYALFVRKTNPIWYRGGSLNTYEFTDKINIGDLTRKNTLVVASLSQDLPESEADYLVYGSDGTIRFKIYLTKGE